MATASALSQCIMLTCQLNLGFSEPIDQTYNDEAHSVPSVAATIYAGPSATPVRVVHVRFGHQVLMPPHRPHRCLLTVLTHSFGYPSMHHKFFIEIGFCPSHVVQCLSFDP